MRGRPEWLRKIDFLKLGLRASLPNLAIRVTLSWDERRLALGSDASLPATSRSCPGTLNRSLQIPVRDFRGARPYARSASIPGRPHTPTEYRGFQLARRVGIIATRKCLDRRNLGGRSPACLDCARSDPGAQSPHSRRSHGKSRLALSAARIFDSLSTSSTKGHDYFSWSAMT